MNFVRPHYLARTGGSSTQTEASISNALKNIETSYIEIPNFKLLYFVGLASLYSIEKTIRSWSEVRPSECVLSLRREMRSLRLNEQL